MAVGGGGGFDEEKFRKLVAHFDNPSRQEAANAFKLALDELAKKNLRFSDVWMGAEEANRIMEKSSGLQTERDKYRAERDEALGRLSKRQAETADLEKVIDRLHEHIGELEQAAADQKPSPGGQDDWLPQPGNPHPPRGGNAPRNARARLQIMFLKFMTTWLPGFQPAFLNLLTMWPLRRTKAAEKRLSQLGRIVLAVVVIAGVFGVIALIASFFN